MIILDINCCTTLFTLVMQSACASSEVALEPWRSCSLLTSALVVLTEVSTTYISLDVEVEVTLRQPVSQYVLASSTLVELATRYYFLSKCYCVIFAVLRLKLICDRRSVGQCVLVSGSCLEPMTRSFFSVCLEVDPIYKPVGSLENAVLCCALFTNPYHSNDGVVLLLVCVAMGMLLHRNEHLQISTVADRLSMFATCGRIPWKAHTI
jgi:hypothetical protein